MGFRRTKPAKGLVPGRPERSFGGSKKWFAEKHGLGVEKGRRSGVLGGGAGGFGMKRSKNNGNGLRVNPQTDQKPGSTLGLSSVFRTKGAKGANGSGS